MQKIICTVIGDAMVDVILPFNNTENVGSLFDGKVVNTNTTISPGGTANLNNCISKLGGRSAFIGKIGNDCFGKMFVRDLDKNNIIKNISISNVKNTGIVFSLVSPSGDRSFIVDRGANIDLDYKDVDFSLIENSKYIYITGYSFQDKKTFKTINKILNGVHLTDVTVIFNPGSPNIAKIFRKLFIKVIKTYVDVIILNEAEACNMFDIGPDEINETKIGLLNFNVEKIIVTKGVKGSIIINRDNTFHIKSCTVEAVDTTGAGDIYAGSFIFGMSKGWKDDKAGEFASKIASNVVGIKGGRISDIYV